MQLREYQSESIAATYDYLRANPGKNPLICIPTGGGKSAIICTICKDAVTKWNARVLVLTHVKELLVQLQETLLRIYPKCDVGINSASLGERHTATKIILAGVQSVFRNAQDLGKINVLIIDECHGIPVGKNGEGMYLTTIQKLKEINPNLRVIGLTATPYRTGSGMVCGPDNTFSEICYDVGVRDLIDQGYLSPLRAKNGGSPDLSKVHKRAGEFMKDEIDEIMSDAALIKKSCLEIVRYGSDRKGWMVFCCSVNHANLVNDELLSIGIRSAVVCGETASNERDTSIAAFKNKEIQCIVNMNVLTTGFDAPHVDLIAMLRPTLSPGLYCQIMGRGLRKSPEKIDCMVLDFAGNIERHGPIDSLNMMMADKSAGKGEGAAPMRTCPECREMLAISLKICPACQYVFPVPAVAKHEEKSSELSPLSEDVETRITHYTVQKHVKHAAPEGAPATVRITLFDGRIGQFNHWLCVEHEGYARKKSEAWFAKFSDVALPKTVEEAIPVVKSALDAFHPRSILVRPGEKFAEVVRLIA